MFLSEVEPMPANRNPSLVKARTADITNKLIEKLSNDTGLDKDKFYTLLDHLKLRLSTKSTLRFLTSLAIHKPEVLSAAYYSYIGFRRNIHDTQAAKVKQFLRFVVNEAAKAPDFSDVDKTAVDDTDYNRDKMEFNEDISLWSKRDDN